jgi:hypothetical protein
MFSVFVKLLTLFIISSLTVFNDFIPQLLLCAKAWIYCNIDFEWNCLKVVSFAQVLTSVLLTSV